jgi:hypothetical protein
MSTIPISQMSNCLACGEANEMVFQLSFSSFKHLDFSSFGTPNDWPNILVSCGRCGVLYRLFDHSQQKALLGLYQSSTYAEHQEDHMVREMAGD